MAVVFPSSPSDGDTVTIRNKQFRYSSTDGAWQQIANGRLYSIDADTFDGNGSTTVFTLSNPSTTQALVVAINGIVQEGGVGKSYTVSGTTLTFADAPSVGERVVARNILTVESDRILTATASELNTLDGITATTAELNYTDGVTSNIQTQLDAKLDSSSYTAADVLTKIKTVDGAGSGLDADLLDGISSASFVRSDADDTLSGVYTIYKATSTSGSSTGTTLLTLSNYVGGDLNQQKTFIDFNLTDDNTNETPQVRIGAEVGYNGDANTQQKEGSGAFVLYTNNADTVSGAAGASLAERFRVDYVGNVGIGTSSPSNTLHVTNSSSTVATGYFNNTSTGGDSPALIVQGGANNNNTVGTFEVRDYNGNTDFHVSGVGDVTVSGYIKASKGIVQTVHNSTNVAASGNPVNIWSEINSNYRVSITPRYSDSRILGTFHIPMNPTGASNILMAIAPWYSTDGGTTKTLLTQGNTAIQGSRHNLAVSWFRSSNGFDGNDMQNHVVHFYHDPGTTSTVTYGWYFRSEGSNNTFFNHSNGNNGTWGWIAPQYLELRELRT